MWAAKGAGRVACARRMLRQPGAPGSLEQRRRRVRAYRVPEEGEELCTSCRAASCNAGSRLL